MYRMQVLDFTRLAFFIIFVKNIELLYLFFKNNLVHPHLDVKGKVREKKFASNFKIRERIKL